MTWLALIGAAMLVYACAWAITSIQWRRTTGTTEQRYRQLADWPDSIATFGNVLLYLGVACCWAWAWA